MKVCLDPSEKKPSVKQYGSCLTLTRSISYRHVNLLCAPPVRISPLLQDTIEFAHIHGIKPKTVVYEGIDNAPEAYKAMRNGDYRVVIRVATE